MPHHTSFEEIEVYKKATLFCDAIWNIIVNTSLQKDCKLKEQLNGSSGSIMDNIAEGFGRGRNREFITFLSFSRGSASESKSQLLRACRRGHISKETHDLLSKEVQELIDQLSKFINYLKKSERRGSKFD